MMPRGALARALAAVIVCAAAAVPSDGADATEIISAQTAAMQLEIGKGKLVRLDGKADTVFVANPDIADIQVKSPSLVYVFGQAVGETTLFAVDAQEEVLASLSVTVVHDLTRLNAALGEMVGDAQITAQSASGALVLTGQAESATAAEDARRLAARFIGKDEEVINRIAVNEANQIYLRVRVAEISRDVVKELGFNWDVAGIAGNFVLGLATGIPVIEGSLLGQNSIPLRPTEANNLLLKRQTGSLDLNGLIEALDREGLISILAEPNLTAMSGETASFLAGGEFPVPVPQSLDRITIEFKKFGVSLSFTPTLLGNGRISLRVRPEVSELSDAGAVTLEGFSIPALTTRRAETTVELASGQSFAIAGLLQNDIDHSVDKFPGLGDLPVLGTLFRSDSFQRNETELVIIATPYVVRPVSGVKMASPRDGLVMPNDIERLITGRKYRPQLQKNAPTPVGPEGQGLTGPVGFVLD